jgi:hypothetical protein
MKTLTLLAALFLAGCAFDNFAVYSGRAFPDREPDSYLADGSPCWYLPATATYGPGRMSCDSARDGI